MEWSKVGLLLVFCLLLEPIAMAAEPSLPRISGITAPDRMPHGCIDCHINGPQDKLDARLSTHARQWAAGVDAKLLAKAKAATPNPSALKGRHPPLGPEAFRNVPAQCTTCHQPAASNVPPLAALMHVIHLTGGRENHFLTIFGGECTYCHKLNLMSGKWSMPSGAEK